LDGYPDDDLVNPGIVYLYTPGAPCGGAVAGCTAFAEAGSVQEEGALGFGRTLSLGPRFLAVGPLVLPELNAVAVEAAGAGTLVHSRGMSQNLES
jgi:hypothetical protein